MQVHPQSLGNMPCNIEAIFNVDTNTVTINQSSRLSKQF